MKTFTLSLKELGYPVNGGTLTAYVAEEPFDFSTPSWTRPAVLIAPGGGYEFTSKREAEPVAFEFLARGFHAFVLNYQVAKDDARYPDQLLQIASAVDCIKARAEEWRIAPDKMFAVGFSAGGHLVGNLAIAHQRIAEISGKALNCKPTAVGLCYPVVSRAFKYQQTHENLLQGYTDEAKAELYKEVNLDENVSKDTPPAYIWTTATDSVVPAQNALSFAMAMANNGIPYELHVYASGEHGLSCATAEVNETQVEHAKCVHGWLDQCVAFFQKYL